MEAHRLAEERGWINVDAMLRSITMKQFAELLEYKRMEPFRELRADYRAAQLDKRLFDTNQHLVDVMFALMNVAEGKRPKIQRTELQDFVLKWGAEAENAKKKVKKERAQTSEQQWKILKLWEAALSKG